VNIQVKIMYSFKDPKILRHLQHRINQIRHQDRITMSEKVAVYRNEDMALST